MEKTINYVPTFRARQQENIVLQEFNFEDRMIPMVEIIKEKDRTNNPKAFTEIYNELIYKIKAGKVLVDLPTYLRDISSMSDEVVKFNRKVLGVLEQRVKHFMFFSELRSKIIPVISSLLFKTGEENTITTQYNKLKEIFPNVAFRSYTNTFDFDIREIQKLLSESDIIIYDMDTLAVTNPLVKKHSILIKNLNGLFKTALRSAINTDIYNVHLEHGEIVVEADNSLMDLYKDIHFDSFGDYVGIKKDDFSAGGTISPGFIFYDPIDNLYYGFKGARKQLSEFKETIVPAVLKSEVVKRLRQEQKEYLDNNKGYDELLSIQNNKEDTGKSQARFKRISMEHYLHAMMTKIKMGEII